MFTELHNTTLFICLHLRIVENFGPLTTSRYTSLKYLQLLRIWKIDIVVARYMSQIGPKGVQSCGLGLMEIMFTHVPRN